MDTPNRSNAAFAPPGNALGFAALKYNRRAKIVATLGPSCSTPGCLSQNWCGPGWMWRA